MKKVDVHNLQKLTMGWLDESFPSSLKKFIKEESEEDEMDDEFIEEKDGEDQVENGNQKKKAPIQKDFGEVFKELLQEKTEEVVTNLKPLHVLHASHVENFFFIQSLFLPNQLQFNSGGKWKGKSEGSKRNSSRRL